MTPNELIDALRRLDPNNQAGMEALATTVRRDSRSLAQAAVAHRQDPNQNLARNASVLARYLDDIAIVPILQAPPPRSVYDRIADLTTVVDSQIELRTSAVKHLEKLLDDQTPMNYSRDASIEESPPDSRVCDEAYVLLRRLLNPGETPKDQLLNARVFLRLPESRRDVERQKARKGIWTNFTKEE